MFQEGFVILNPGARKSLGELVCGSLEGGRETPQAEAGVTSWPWRAKASVVASEGGEREQERKPECVGVGAGGEELL